MSWLRKKGNEKGEILLEALIVYSVTIMLLFLILTIFTTLYQRWNIQIIANEAATRYAQTYRFKTANDETGKVERDDFIDLEHYRYTFSSDSYEESVKNRLMVYSMNRLSKTTFTKDVVTPKIEVEVKNDSIGRRHIIVDIIGEYRVPFGEILGFLGFESTTTYEVTAYAECLDIIDYINTVDFVDDVTSLEWMDSGFVKLINSVLSLFDNVFGED